MADAARATSTLGAAAVDLGDLRAWTRFLSCAWRDPAIACPACALPAVDVGRLGLAPLAYRVLRDRGDARASQFEPHYRAAALRNLATVARVAHARDLLAVRGIPAVLIKGGAFLLRHSPSDLGVRAMADFDLLVGPDRFDEAFALLTGAGWRRTSPDGVLSGHMAPAVGLDTSGPNGLTTYLDLHRSLAHWPLLPHLPGRVVASATEVSGWKLCSDAHAALVAAVHRARNGFANDARDLLDLATTASALGEAGWERLAAEASWLKLTGALYAALRQAAWWFDDPGTTLASRAAGLQARLGSTQAALLSRISPPTAALTRSAPLASPLGRSLGVFPLAFEAPLRSLVSASTFLPVRLVERSARLLGRYRRGRPPTAARKAGPAGSGRVN